jgi:hypothetical protein
MFIISFLAAENNVVDDTTEHWPVKDTLRPELDQIKFDFEACPLPVYVGNHFIKPQDVHTMLKGALVEVHFKLKHFCICKKKEDSLNSTIQQVLILQPGKARPPNAFKRHNVFDGLLCSCPLPKLSHLTDKNVCMCADCAEEDRVVNEATGRGVALLSPTDLFFYPF